MTELYCLRSTSFHLQTQCNKTRIYKQTTSLSRKISENDCQLFCFANAVLRQFANVTQGLSKQWSWVFYFSRHFWGGIRHSLKNGHVPGRNSREDEGEGKTQTSGAYACRTEPCRMFGEGFDLKPVPQNLCFIKRLLIPFPKCKNMSTL